MIENESTTIGAALTPYGFCYTIDGGLSWIEKKRNPWQELRHQVVMTLLTSCYLWEKRAVILSALQAWILSAMQNSREHYLDIVLAEVEKKNGK